jgi:hypothetical protein
MTNTTEMIFGTLDADKSVAIELKHDDKLPSDSHIHVQVNDDRTCHWICTNVVYIRLLFSIRA